MFIGGGLALAMKVTTLNPVSKLAQMAGKLSEGDYTVRTRTPDTGDEINTLARAFNDMAEKIEHRTGELEASRRELSDWNDNLEMKVQQRTAEITSLNNKLENMNLVRKQLLEKIISAQEEERRRIARELHDRASQSLAAVVINLNNMSEILPDECREKLEVLKGQTIQTLNWIRNLGVELRPSVLDDLGLFAAIEWYARDFLGKRSVNLTVQFSGQEKLPKYAETILFRIVQEALTNVIKHSEATQVHVRLNMTKSDAVLEIDDNGRGFDTEKISSPNELRQNLGLHGMIERAALLGGSLSINSNPGKGTCIRVIIPLSEEKAHQQNKSLVS